MIRRIIVFLVFLQDLAKEHAPGDKDHIRCNDHEDNSDREGSYGCSAVRILNSHIVCDTEDNDPE